ncbi:MAG: hypothetical protein ACOX32_02795 [Bacteroidaceae bacterium]|jgi:hypothetical protein
MKQNKNCSFLLSTYDGGEDLWEGFFKALSVQWPEMDMKVYINTETKNFQYPGFDIQVCNQKTKEELPWATRLINTLKCIDTEYVLFFLEDFWLAERVDDDFFRRTMQWMKENPDVANFSFYPCLPGTNIDDGRFERFELRPQKCKYKYNCQVGLWRTKELISFFKPDESPWEWECFGSMRAGKNKQKFYSLKEDAPLVFSYGDNLKGCIIHRGKWVKDEVLPLAEKYGLEIDYSKRGFEDFDEYWRSQEKQGIKGNLKHGRLIPAISAIISRLYHTWKAMK